MKIDETTTDYLATLGAGQSSTENVISSECDANNKDQVNDVRGYLARVVEELKDPAKRQTKTETKTEVKAENSSLDIDESDYVPATNGAAKGGDDTESMPTSLAQRELILKEIAAFRERSNRRDRNRTWYDEEEKGSNEKDYSSPQTDTRRPRASDKHEDRRPLKATSTQENIPSGPAADRRRGTRDYHQGVKFRVESDRYDRDEDEDIPDEELEKRRVERKKKDLEATFVEVNYL